MLVILLSVYLLNWIYFSFLLSGSWQATLGMKLLKIRIVDGVGNRISFKRASARFFASILSALLLFVGFLIIPFNRKKQGLHDLVAGTFVLKNKPSQRPTPVLPPVGDAGSINPCPTGSRYITVQAASHHNSHARFPFLLFRRPILQLVSIVIGGIVLVLLVGALLGEIKPGGGSDVTDSVASSLPTTSFEKNDNSPRPLVDASETTRVWNQFIAIERDLNNAPPNDNVESMRAAIAGLQLLSSNSDKADPKVMELINRFINWLHNFIAFFNNASDIVQSDPNNQMLSTIPARLQTEKTMEDIMSEANSLGEYQNNLRIELQNKYQIQLDER
jgi:hypothetical protein